VMAGPLTRAAVFRSLVAMLLETFPNPAVARATGDGGRAAPPTLRRAICFIEEHASDDIGLADIAAAAGLGARGLQLAFRRHHDTTPLEYLRRVRLDRAHRELQASTPTDATVSRIADHWGFPHHGNFSALYLRTYGCSPSITLRS
jgi:AraC-like DNA-binding protein